MPVLGPVGEILNFRPARREGPRSVRRSPAGRRAHGARFVPAR